MSNTLQLSYEFTFSSGPVHTFDVTLDAHTLENRNPVIDRPAWTRLEFQQCPHCPLARDARPHCPPAVYMTPIVDAFAHTPSIEDAQVVVRTPQREFRKPGGLQAGLSSLVGLVMVTSGCPILDNLRPMAHTHLPFADARETVYRAASTYLLAQYFRLKKGLAPDWELRNLASIYADVQKVNHSFARRLAQVNTEDANINSLVRLDCFASAIALSITGGWWDEIESFFGPYAASVGREQEEG